MDPHPDSFPTDVEFAKLVITFASLSLFSIPHKIISLFIPGGKLQIQGKKFLRNSVFVLFEIWVHLENIKVKLNKIKLIEKRRREDENLSRLDKCR